MVKNVNRIKDGDIKSNIVTLRSVYGKVGQKYFIQPQVDPKTGRFPDCVKRVDSHGDIILTEAEKEDEANDVKAFVREDRVFEITDGKTYNLDDIYQRAEWEAIKNCDLIAPDRYAKNDKGDYLIDGTVDTKSTKPRYGVAELYIDRPGFESTRRVTRKKQILQASNFIMNDVRGYEGRVLIARVLGRNMNNQPNSVVEDYLLSVAEKTPEKIIDCYTGGDLNLRMLFIQARENKVIIKRNGLYMYGESTVLGTTDDAVIDWMKQPKNTKTLALIRRESFPEMYEDEEFDETPSQESADSKPNDKKGKK